MHDDETSRRLPPGYTLDLVGDPCVIVLRRPDGTIAARFGRYVEAQEIRRVAEEDRARLDREPDD
jgi:hypothetical protein